MAVAKSEGDARARLQAAALELFRERGYDRILATGYFDAVRCSFANRIAYPLRRLVTRIVVRQNHEVREFGGDNPHLASLADIAPPTRAKH